MSATEAGFLGSNPLFASDPNNPRYVELKNESRYREE